MRYRDWIRAVAPESAVMSSVLVNATGTEMYACQVSIPETDCKAWRAAYPAEYKTLTGFDPKLIVKQR